MWIGGMICKLLLKCCESEVDQSPLRPSDEWFLGCGEKLEFE